MTDRLVPDRAQEAMRASKYFLFVGILFVAVLMISNTVAVKLIGIGPFVFTGAIFIFPLSYIFGDVLTEVYGYRASRKIIWAGFFALILMSLGYYLVQVLPAASGWSGQGAYEAVLGSVPRVVIASIIAYFAGEFCNSFVISRLKVRTRGRYLWMRTIASTVVGQGVDTALFTAIAFLGVIPPSILVVAILSGYLFKVVYEAVLTPVTYVVVNWLKRIEGIDAYDEGVRYNPFLIEG